MQQHHPGEEGCLLRCSLGGAEGLEVGEGTDGIVLVEDAVSAADLPTQPNHLSGSLHHEGLGSAQVLQPGLALVIVGGRPEAEQQDGLRVGHHPDDLVLDELEGSDGATELLPNRGVLDCCFVAAHADSRSDPQRVQDGQFCQLEDGSRRFCLLKGPAGFGKDGGFEGESVMRQASQEVYVLDLLDFHSFQFGGLDQNEFEHALIVGYHEEEEVFAVHPGQSAMQGEALGCLGQLESRG
jgi:hypothetical protein